MKTQNTSSKKGSYSISNSEEFDNLIAILKLQIKLNKIVSEIEKAKIVDISHRKKLLSEFYNVSYENIDELVNTSHPDRRSLCINAGINGYIFRTLFDYNSYQDCYHIYRYLGPKVDFSKFKILDYGCSVSDYGFFFGNLGAVVTFCDFKEQADFTDFRMEQAGINRVKVYAPTDYMEITKGQNLAVFGEVLEHLVDPLQMLQSCVENNVEYIYTTCYPYGDDGYFRLNGHRLEAQDQSPQSFELLRKYYEEVSIFKLRRLWVRK